MLTERYRLEAERIAGLKLDQGADLAHPVFGEGCDASPRLMFIGEAPGKDEAACGRPFVGRAGKQLDHMLALAGIERAECFVTNSVKYRPMKVNGAHASNRTPTAKEVKDGLPLLSFEIEKVDPAVIATLGNVPLGALALLAGESDKLSVGSAHGMPMILLIGGKPRRVFPIYHPAAAIYNRELKPVLERDLVSLGGFIRSL